MEIADFIRSVLIEELKEIQQDKDHLYLSFNLICQGIEFLGACLDKEPFSAKGLSAARFRKAIHDLFPVAYHRFNQGSGRPFDLYEDLRCSLLHAILPGSCLEFIRQCEKETLQANHLEVKDVEGVKRLVLVLEDLSDDYEKACREVIERISQGRLKGWKFAEGL